MQNGHIVKDPPLSGLSPAHSSLQAPSQNVESVVLNGTKASFSQVESSQNSTEVEEAHSSPLHSGDDQIDAHLSSASEAGQGASGKISANTVVNNDAMDSTSTTIQPPTSDLREGIHPVSSQHVAEIKSQNHQMDLGHGSESAKGLEAAGPDPISRTIDTLPVPHPTSVTPVAVGNHASEPGSPPAITSVATAEGTKESILGVENTSVIKTTEIPHHPSVPIPDNAEPEQPLDPAPSPAQVPTSTEHAVPTDLASSLSPAHVAPTTASTVEPSNDQEMKDIPTSPPKLTRERDDDEMTDAPAAKRSKTEGDSSVVPEFKVPDLPQINTSVNIANGDDSKTAVDQTPITKPQHKFLLRLISNIKRVNDAAPFNKPVDIVALNIPNYPSIITEPMDLRTMEEKLKSNQYSTVAVFVDDFNLIVQNCITFNGLDHAVTKNAQNIKASFDKQMVNLPGPEITEPSPADKKKKAPTSATTKAAPSRRESRSSLPGSARSPLTVASPTTFALGPQGVPLIRRDSTVGDGRPKREIHPPAPRDLPYANQKPKKKKYQLELKFCQYIMAELLKPKYSQYAFPFLVPVDPVALNIPHYHKLIKNPMDLGTVDSKLNHGQYENAKEFEADLRLIFLNCYKFNPSSDPVHGMGKSLEAVLDEKWAEKAKWIEANTPGSGPQSPGSTPEPDDDEDEEEDEDEDEEEEQSQLSKLQQQIAAMSRQVELITQKKNPPPVPAKKAKGGKPNPKKDGKKTAAAAPAKTEKKPTKASKKPYVTYEQKQDISNRINSLSETRMATALKIIRDNMPSLKVCAHVNSVAVQFASWSGLIPHWKLTLLDYRVYKKMRSSLISMSSPMMFFTNSSSLCGNTHREQLMTPLIGGQLQLRKTWLLGKKTSP